MAQTGTRTVTELALDDLSSPAAYELVEDNYSARKRSLEMLLLSADLEWAIKDPIVVPAEFPVNHKKSFLHP